MAQQIASVLANNLTNQSRNAPTMSEMAGSDIRVTADVNTDSHQVLDINQGFSVTTQVYLSSLNVGTGSIQFNSTTQYFTRPRDWEFLIPVTMTFTNSNLAVTTATNAPPFQTRNTLFDQNYQGINCPPWAALQIFNSVNVTCGNNSLKVGPPLNDNRPGSYFNAWSFPYSEEDYAKLAQVGLPVARFPYIGTNAVTAPNVCGNSIVPYEQERQLRGAWQDIYRSNIIANGGISTVLTTETSPYTTSTFYLHIPVAMVNNFWNTDGMFPPGLPFRFDIQYNTSAITLAVNDSLFTSQVASSITCTVQTSNSWQIAYQGYTLTPQLMQQFSASFIEKPLSYYQDDWQAYDIACNNSTTTFNQLVQSNNQYPTQIWIFAYNANLAYTDISNYPITLTNTNGTALTTGYTYQYWGQSPQPIALQNVKVTIGGINVLYDNMQVIDNKYYLWATSQGNKRPFDAFYNDSNYRAYAEVEKKKIKTGAVNLLEGYPYVLTLDNDYPQQDKIGTPQGPAQIFMEFEAKRADGSALPSGYAIRIAFRKTLNTAIYGTGVVQQFRYPNFRQGTNQQGVAISKTGAQGNLVTGPSLNQY